MLCPNCNAENRADAKFCGECGAGLAATCAVCGTPSEAGRKFCYQCGSPLRDAPAPVAAGVTALPRQSPATERRLVSILFADLVGFTPLSETRDAEKRSPSSPRHARPLSGLGRSPGSSAPDRRLTTAANGKR